MNMLRTPQAIYADLDTAQHEDHWCRLALRLLERQSVAEMPHLDHQRALLLRRRAVLKRRTARLRDEAFAVPSTAGTRGAARRCHAECLWQVWRLWTGAGQ